MAGHKDKLNPTGATTTQLRAEIEQTRAAMDQTLERLGTRVQPRHLLDDVLDFFQNENGSEDNRAQRTMREAGTVALDKLKSNPMPATLIGAGLAWLLFQDKRSGTARQPAADYDPYLAPGPSIHSTPDAEGEGLLGRAAHKLTDAKEAATDSLSSARHKLAAKTEDTAHRAKGAMQEILEQAPLGVGLAALAAGLLTGLVLPGTRAEDELMGEASDSVKAQAKGVGEEVVQAAVSAEPPSSNAPATQRVPKETVASIESLTHRAFDSMRDELES